MASKTHKRSNKSAANVHDTKTPLLSIDSRPSSTGKDYRRLKFSRRKRKINKGKVAFITNSPVKKLQHGKIKYPTEEYLNKFQDYLKMKNKLSRGFFQG